MSTTTLLLSRIIRAANPRVFFGITLGKSPVERIVMELRKDVTPKTAAFQGEQLSTCHSKLLASGRRFCKEQRNRRGVAEA